MNSPWKLVENITPFADFRRPEQAVGSFARAADEMNGGPQNSRIQST